MLVRDLTRLMESGDYRQCLDCAVVLLDQSTHDLEARARIHAAICRCKLELTDFFGAAEAGERALELAEAAAMPDLVGSVLVDLGQACLKVRRFDRARSALLWYLDELTSFTAAQCREGLALQLLAEVLDRSGCPEEASERYLQAQRWYLRFGDVKRAAQCVRAVIRMHLEQGAPNCAVEMLRESDCYAAEHPDDQEFLTDHLLDRALFHLVTGRFQESIQEAFQALESAGDRLHQQCRAHLILCQNALATNQPKDALNFALAARVAAIDGRYYDLEFEASEILFRLLRERGTRMLRDLEADYYAQGVDIYHYLSERAVRRMLSDH